jgi:hypothetical protein
MTESNQLTISTNNVLSNQLLGLSERLEQAARRNVHQWLEQNPQQSFTITEKRAMVKLEQLKLTGDLTLAEIILRGDIIREIESHGLWSSHPMGYGSMEEAATAQGISISEYSNIRDLTDIIFPFLTDMGYNIAELWEDIGKSKFRELVPILKRIITDEPSSSRMVEQLFTSELDNIFATASAQGNQITEDQARHTLIDQLLEAGTLPVRELRQRIRPERAPTTNAYQLPSQNNNHIVMMVIDTNQIRNLIRRLNGFIDIRPISQEDILYTSIGRQLREVLRFDTNN